MIYVTWLLARILMYVCIYFWLFLDSYSYSYVCTGSDALLCHVMCKSPYVTCVWERTRVESISID